MDITSKIMAFESNELDTTEVAELFAELGNTGMTWKLQGFYGRTHAALVSNGLLTEREGKWAADYEGIDAWNDAVGA